MNRVYFIIKTPTMEHPKQRTVPKLRRYKRFHNNSSFLYNHIYGATLARTFDLQLALLQMLLIWFLKVRLESIVIPKSTCSYSDSI